MMNEAIRRINLQKDDTDPKGLLITAQDIIYSEGILEF